MRNCAATISLATLILGATACDRSDPIIQDGGATSRLDASTPPDAGFDAGMEADGGEIDPPCDITQAGDIVSDLLVRQGCRLFVTQSLSVGSGATLTLEPGAQMVTGSAFSQNIGIANIDIDFDEGPDPVACARFTDAAASNRFDLAIPCE